MHHFDKPTCRIWVLWRQVLFGDTLVKSLYLALLLPALTAHAEDMAKVRGGAFRPLYLKADAPLVRVNTFALDKKPVTNARFAAFIQKHPEWARGRVGADKAEADYLKHWVKQGSGYTFKPQDADKPVVNVSWYAAVAYCRAQGKRLPDTREWEYVARASAAREDGSKEKGYRQTILNWYARAGQAPLRAVGQSRPNYWGIYDMHGLIWEWTQDFINAGIATGSDARGGVDPKMFCGGGAGAADPGDYAAFMRYGFRSSLKSTFTLNSLGFRCAK